MSVMISTEEIQAKVKELGAQIDAHYAYSALICVPSYFTFGCISFVEILTIICTLLFSYLKNKKSGLRPLFFRLILKTNFTNKWQMTVLLVVV